MRKYLVNISSVLGLLILGCLCGCKSNQEGQPEISKQPPANSGYIHIKEGQEKSLTLNPGNGTIVKIKTYFTPPKPNTVLITGYINNTAVSTETKVIPIGKKAIVYLSQGLTSVKIKLVKGYKVSAIIFGSTSRQIPEGSLIIEIEP